MTEDTLLDRLFRVPNKPFILGFDEWEEWEAEAKKQYPIRYFMSETLPIKWGRFTRICFRDPWYWLKCAVWHKYNVVKCRRLGPTWCDRDHLLVHAVFQILTDFIDKEKPWQFEASDKEIIDAYSGDGFGDMTYASTELANWTELKRLYFWWKGFDPMDDYHGSWDTITENMVRVIRLRKYLWT